MSDVIARHRTANGALVVLTEGLHEITGTCTGCRISPQTFYFDQSLTGSRMESYTVAQADDWAETNAGTCRNPAR